jgi:hypothetical protein
MAWTVPKSTAHAAIAAEKIKGFVVGEEAFVFMLISNVVE